MYKTVTPTQFAYIEFNESVNMGWFSFAGDARYEHCGSGGNIYAQTR